MFLVFGRVIVHIAYTSNSWYSSPSRMTIKHCIMENFIYKVRTLDIHPEQRLWGGRPQTWWLRCLYRKLQCDSGPQCAVWWWRLCSWSSKVCPNPGDKPNLQLTLHLLKGIKRKIYLDWYRESCSDCLLLIQELNLFLLIIIQCTVIDTLCLVWTNCSLQLYYS